MNSIRFGFHSDRELLVELERFVGMLHQMKKAGKQMKNERNK
jgi:hypothetical protein